VRRLVEEEDETGPGEDFVDLEEKVNDRRGGAELDEGDDRDEAEVVEREPGDHDALEALEGSEARETGDVNEEAEIVLAEVELEKVDVLVENGEENEEVDTEFVDEFVVNNGGPDGGVEGRRLGRFGDRWLHALLH